MQFTNFLFMLPLGIFLPAAMGTALPAVDSVDGVDAVDSPDVTCESGTNHNLGTSCHGSIGDFACSSNDRGYILQCESDGLWGNYVTCGSGTGCHNCACTPGY